MLQATEEYILERVVKYFEGRPYSFHVLFNVAVIFTFGAFELAFDPNLATAIFYLLPILLGTWFGGRGLGFFLATTSALIWFLANRPAFSNYYLEPYWNTLARFALFVITLSLLDRVRGELNLARALARTDALTGAVNRRAFYEALDLEINRMSRHGRPLTLAYVDVDGFKGINDLLGHAVGDQLLCCVVDTLANNTRKTDLVVRLGGDEFAVFLPETGAEGARTLFPKLNELLLQRMIDRDWPVTFSIGVVTYQAVPSSFDQVIQRADEVMYEVKRSGKNRIGYELIGEANGQIVDSQAETSGQPAPSRES